MTAEKLVEDARLWLDSWDGIDDTMSQGLAAIRAALSEIETILNAASALPEKWEAEVAKDREQGPSGRNWNAGVIRLNDATDLHRALQGSDTEGET